MKRLEDYVVFKHEKASSSYIDIFKEVVVLLCIVFVIRSFVFGLYQVPTGSMETTMLVGERFFADKFSYLFSDPKQGDIISFNEPQYSYSKNMIRRLWEKYVWGPANWTKRVIAVPGQTIEGKVEDGHPTIYVDGKKLAESYLNKYPLIEEYSEELIERPRSFDSTRAYNEQPFYDVNPVYVRKEPDGSFFQKKPNTPLKHDLRHPSYNDGTNYWNGSDVFYGKLGPGQYWAMGDNRLGSHDSRFFGPIHRDLIHGKIVFRIWSNDSDSAWWILDLLKNPLKFFKQMRWCRFFNWVT